MIVYLSEKSGPKTWIRWFQGQRVVSDNTERDEKSIIQEENWKLGKKFLETKMLTELTEVLFGSV